MLIGEEASYTHICFKDHSARFLLAVSEIRTVNEILELLFVVVNFRVVTFIDFVIWF